MTTPPHPAAAGAPAPQAGDPFVDISPPGLSSSDAGEEQVVASFAGSLIMGVIDYDANARVDLRRVLRFGGLDRGWTTLHRTAVSLGAQEELPPAPVMEAAAAAILPGPGSDRLIVRLSSPLATHALLSGDGREFLPVAAAAPEVLEAFSLRQFARSPRHRFALSWFGGRSHLRQAPTDDPDAPWREVPLPQGAGGELPVGSLAVFGEHLVVGCNDPERGFELHQLTDPAVPVWEPKITRGGQRFSPSGAILALVPWNDALYVVAGRGERGARERPWLPRGFEVIRVYPDFSWDLIAGTPRITDAGLKIPLAGLAAGLDDFRPADFRGLAAHGGEMLLGAYEVVEGFRVFSSNDGERWSAVPHLDLSGLSNVAAARFHPTDAGVVLELDLDDPRHGRKVSLWLRQDT